MDIYQEPESKFLSNGKAYDLNPLFPIAAHKQTESIALESLTWQLTRPLNSQRVDRANLAYPIIITTIPGGLNLIVDGEHRVRKALNRGHRFISAKRITPEELEAVRIDNPATIELDIPLSDIQYFEQIANIPSPISANIPIIQSPLCLICRYHTSQEWRIVSNPDFTCIGTSDKLAAEIMEEFFVDYVEYQNAGVVYRIVRIEDLPKYWKPDQSSDLD